MTKQLFYKNLADNIEKERINLGYTQKQMADALDLSLSAYKRLIRCETMHMDFYLSYKLYKLTGKLSYELVGYNDELVQLVTMLRGMDKKHKDHIGDLMNLLGE